jgi:hypothetical protein
MWGMKVGAKHYSDNAVKRLNELIDKRRELFRAEYAFALKQRNDLYIGSRFNDNEKILWVLESKIDEYKFMLTPELYIDNVLLGAAESDYYYTYEKEW